MYNNIYELPTAVLNSLNEKDAQYWMDQYNRCDPQSQDEVLKAMKNAWHACATRPSSFSFEIVGSADIVDDYNTIIDLDRIKELLDETIRHGGNIQNDHHNYQIGALWDWKPCKVKQKDGKEVDGVLIYGNLFGGGYVYDKARKSFIDGMNNLSVAGEAPEKAYECDERGCYVRRKLKQLMEISLTRSPGNKDCTLQWYNKDASVARSSSVGIPIHEYTIHRDESTCPIMSLQRSLEKIGYECTAHHDGVHVPMDFDEYVEDEPIFRSHGLDIDYCDGYATVKRNEKWNKIHTFKAAGADYVGAVDGTNGIPNSNMFAKLDYNTKQKDAKDINGMGPGMRHMRYFIQNMSRDVPYEMQNLDENIKSESDGNLSTAYIPENMDHRIAEFYRHYKSKGKDVLELADNWFKPEKNSLEPLGPESAYYRFGDRAIHVPSDISSGFNSSMGTVPHETTHQKDTELGKYTPYKSRIRDDATRSDLENTFGDKFNIVDDVVPLIDQLGLSDKMNDLLYDIIRAYMIKNRPEYTKDLDDKITSTRVPVPVKLYRKNLNGGFDRPMAHFDGVRKVPIGHSYNYFSERIDNPQYETMAELASMPMFAHDTDNMKLIENILPETSTELYKSMQEYTAQTTKRSLEAIGYENCELCEDGVHIPMDFNEYVEDEHLFRSHGLDIDYKDGYATVTRAAKWKDVVGGYDAMQDYRNSTGPTKGWHQKYDMLGGMEGDDGTSAFDPEAFELVHTDMKDMFGGYYEAPATLNSTKYNSNYAGALNTFRKDKGHGGVITEYYPNAKVAKINNADDWNKLLDRYGVTEEDDDGEPYRYLPFENLIGDYDVVETTGFLPSTLREYIRGLKTGDDEYDRSINARTRSRLDGFEGNVKEALDGENFRILLNPYAIANSQYVPSAITSNIAGNTDIKNNRNETIKEFDRAASLQKLGERYAKAGIPVPWFNTDTMSVVTGDSVIRNILAR